MKKFILSVSLAIIFQISYSQSDYAITVKGDTLRGKIKIFTYDVIDRVQVKAEKKKNTYTALEVKTISLNRTIYHSVQFDKRYRFMILLKSGYLSLYGFRMENQHTYDGRYLLKQDGGATEVPNISFKKVLEGFLSDCPAVTEQIKNGDYSRKDLDSLITVYNNCIEENTKKAAQGITNPQSIPALETLKVQIEKSELSSKKDVLDLLSDIDTKTRNNQPVPNYLIEGLRGYLTNTEFRKALEALVDALPKN